MITFDSTGLKLWVLDDNTGYKSDSNWHVNNGVAKMKVTFSGVSSLEIRYSSYGESNYDYLVISELNYNWATISSFSKTTAGVLLHTYGASSSTKYNNSYTFLNLDPNSTYFIWVVYRKDGSGNVGDDRAYFSAQGGPSILAKESDAKDIGKSSGSIITNKLCTYSRAIELGCKVFGIYSSNLIVRKENLSQSIAGKNLIIENGTNNWRTVYFKISSGSSVSLFEDGGSVLCAEIPPGETYTGNVSFTSDYGNYVNYYIGTDSSEDLWEINGISGYISDYELTFDYGGTDVYIIKYSTSVDLGLPLRITISL